MEMASFTSRREKFVSSGRHNYTFLDMTRTKFILKKVKTWKKPLSCPGFTHLDLKPHISVCFAHQTEWVPSNTARVLTKVYTYFNSCACFLSFVERSRTLRTWQAGKIKKDDNGHSWVSLASPSILSYYLFSPLSFLSSSPIILFSNFQLSWFRFLSFIFLFVPFFPFLSIHPPFHLPHHPFLLSRPFSLFSLFPVCLPFLSLPISSPALLSFQFFSFLISDITIKYCVDSDK